MRPRAFSRCAVFGCAIAALAAHAQDPLLNIDIVGSTEGKGEFRIAPGFDVTGEGQWVKTLRPSLRVATSGGAATLLQGGKDVAQPFGAEANLAMTFSLFAPLKQGAAPSPALDQARDSAYEECTAECALEPSLPFCKWRISQLGPVVARALAPGNVRIVSVEGGTAAVGLADGGVAPICEKQAKAAVEMANRLDSLRAAGLSAAQQESVEADARARFSLVLAECREACATPTLSWDPVYCRDPRVEQLSTDARARMVALDDSSPELCRPGQEILKAYNDKVGPGAVLQQPMTILNFGGRLGYSKFTYLAAGAVAGELTSKTTHGSPWAVGLSAARTVAPGKAALTFGGMAHVLRKYDASSTSARACRDLGTLDTNGATVQACSDQVSGAPAIETALKAGAFIGVMDTFSQRYRVALTAEVTAPTTSSATVADVSVSLPAWLNALWADTKYQGVIRIVPALRVKVPTGGPEPEVTVSLSVALLGRRFLLSEEFDSM